MWKVKPDKFKQETKGRFLFMNIGINSEGVVKGFSITCYQDKLEGCSSSAPNYLVLWRKYQVIFYIWCYSGNHIAMNYYLWIYIFPVYSGSSVDPPLKNTSCRYKKYPCKSPVKENLPFPPFKMLLLMSQTNTFHLICLSHINQLHLFPYF